MDRTKMELLHARVLQRYLDACLSTDVSATMLQAAAKFLRDNGVVMEATDRPATPGRPDLLSSVPFVGDEAAAG